MNATWPHRGLTSISTIAIMAHLMDNPKQNWPYEIAKKIGMNDGAIFHSLKRLEAKGLVVSGPDIEDFGHKKVRIRYYVTVEGKKVTEAVRAQLRQIIK